MPNEFTLGDIDGGLTLTANDRLYESHVNELRRRSASYFNAGYYGSTWDQVTIQAAIDAAEAAGGGMVILPAGTWTLTAPFELKDDVWVRGTGWGTKVVAASSRAVTMTAARHRWRVSDMKIDCSGVSSTSAFLCYSDSSWFSIENCWILGGNNSLAISKCNNYWVLKNRIQGATTDNNIGIDGNSAWNEDFVVAYNIIFGASEAGIETDGFVRNGIIAFNRSYDNTVGIELDAQTSYADHSNAGRLVVMGNVCEGNSSHGINGVGSATADKTNARKTLIVGNHCNNNTGSGIRIDELCDDLTINNNQCISNSSIGIDIRGSSGYTVKRVQIHDNAVSYNSNHGIYLIYADYPVVKGNYCYQNENQGIYAVSCTEPDINDNEVIDASNSTEGGTYQNANWTCDATANWTATDNATNLTLDNTTYKEGTGALNFDANNGPTISATWNAAGTIDLTDYDNNRIFLWVYIPNVTNFTRVAVRFTDSGSSYNEYYMVFEVPATAAGWRFININLTATPDVSSGTLNWSLIDSVAVKFYYSSAVSYTDFRVDDLRIGGTHGIMVDEITTAPRVNNNKVRDTRGTVRMLYGARINADDAQVNNNDLRNSYVYKGLRIDGSDPQIVGNRV